MLYMGNRSHGESDGVGDRDLKKGDDDDDSGGSGRGIDWEFGTDMYTLLYLEQITNKDLL